MRSALSNRLDQAEWHDLALTSPIGQGYLLDLLRQRGPIEHIRSGAACYLLCEC